LEIWSIRDENQKYNEYEPPCEVKYMKKTLTILLAGLLMIMASAAVVYAEEEEEDGAEGAEENEPGEGESGEEEENSIPGFELSFAAAALGGARLLIYRNN
jgi:hypothetical protein